MKSLLRILATVATLLAVAAKAQKVDTAKVLRHRPLEQTMPNSTTPRSPSTSSTSLCGRAELLQFGDEYRICHKKAMDMVSQIPGGDRPHG